MQAYQLSIVDAARQIADGQLSPVELTRSVLERAQQQETRLSAYVTLAADQAMAAARQAEQEILGGGYRGVLHGIPYTLKDLIDAAGLPTTASSRVRQHHRAETDSAVAAQLRRAGMILTGKTHTHEFAFGLTTPQTNNPWAPERSPGGSSGGSAAAVAYGGALAALGTDTGGSIRVPAALCGLVGLKPTYGLVSRQGVVPLSDSLDHVGPITRTVADAAAMLDAIASARPAPAGGYRQGLTRAWKACASACPAIISAIISRRTSRPASRTNWRNWPPPARSWWRSRFRWPISSCPSNGGWWRRKPPPTIGTTCAACRSCMATR